MGGRTNLPLLSFHFPTRNVTTFSDMQDQLRITNLKKANVESRKAKVLKIENYLSYLTDIQINAKSFYLLP